MKKFVDQKNIVGFVDAVETKKGFTRSPDKIFRHIVSELGELDGVMHKIDEIDKYSCPMINTKQLRKSLCQKIGRELTDILFLTCYMADVYGTDLNQIIPQRMAEIKKQYNVDYKIKRR